MSCSYGSSLKASRRSLQLAIQAKFPKPRSVIVFDAINVSGHTNKTKTVHKIVSSGT